MRILWMGLLCIALAVCALFVFLLGGSYGAYAWSIAIFIIAPLGVLTLFFQLIFFICSFFGKKKHKIRRIIGNVIAIVFAVVLVAPLAIPIGLSPLAYPRKAISEENSTKILMPVEGGLAFGGAKYEPHRMWPADCYAYDIVKDPYFETEDKKLEKLEDYGIYGADVMAPINGEVVAVVNDEPDNEPGDTTFNTTFGNYVCIKYVIEYEGGETEETFIILAHLKPESVTVAEGDTVTCGQVIAKVGNSGNSAVPHLHIHQQTKHPSELLFPSLAVSMPIMFAPREEMIPSENPEEGAPAQGTGTGSGKAQ